MVGRSRSETFFYDDHDGPRATYRTFHGPSGMSSATITSGSSTARPRSDGSGLELGPRKGVDDSFQREILSCRLRRPTYFSVLMKILNTR
ncbi:hypothetical protein HD806DRAFT_410826 [Xylariaceae sp. AK1471]|nr:hypothetical protein HD806DRAFT_410826 [Xylariaceae sp. AK1471]